MPDELRQKLLARLVEQMPYVQWQLYEQEHSEFLISISFVTGLHFHGCTNEFWHGCGKSQSRNFKLGKGQFIRCNYYWVLLSNFRPPVSVDFYVPAEFEDVASGLSFALRRKETNELFRSLADSSELLWEKLSDDLLEYLVEPVLLLFLPEVHHRLEMKRLYALACRENKQWGSLKQ